jgi:hypothetical protein
MAKFAVLGVKGEKGYWLVNFDAGTVAPIVDIVSDPFGYTAEARTNGAVLTAGVDLAVVVVSESDVFSGHYDTGAFAAHYD